MTVSATCYAINAINKPPQTWFASFERRSYVTYYLAIVSPARSISSAFLQQNLSNQRYVSKFFFANVVKNLNPLLQNETFDSVNLLGSNPLNVTKLHGCEIFLCT